MIYYKGFQLALSSSPRKLVVTRPFVCFSRFLSFLLPLHGDTQRLSKYSNIRFVAGYIEFTNKRKLSPALFFHRWTTVFNFNSNSNFQLFIHSNNFHFHYRNNNNISFNYYQFDTRSSSTSAVIPNLKTMKLDNAEFKSIFSPELDTLIHLFNKHGFELRIAGGAVRDLLLGKVPDDIDFATTATPQEMKDMFNDEEIRMINTNGESHGTITARINDKENFEVTTLRIDVTTDGRKAEVEFTKDWMLDANRRDLTINSMFLGLDGTVYDYFNGIEDLKNKKICFVGNPEHRIQEDYLRILRYFRFYGRIAGNEDAHEDSMIMAIKSNAEGLNRVSGERIWIEMKKILSGKMAASLIQKMIELGLGTPIGLPNAKNFYQLRTICERTKGQSVHHMTRLAAILECEEDVYTLHAKIKMSNEELSLVLFILKHRDDDLGDDLLRYCTDLFMVSSGNESKLMAKVIELMKYKGHPEVGEKFSTIELPKFPIKGEDLVALQVPRGPKFACTLNELRQIWIQSRYSLSKEELCQHVPTILENLPQNSKGFKKMRKK